MEKNKINCMKEWIAEHLIGLWVIASIVFAFVIHCLFSISAKNDWWEAKWGAGDILTYVSTVSLGLLAVWQNKKFKEESDMAEQSMERVAKQANEIAMINKIISYENERNLQLQYKVNSFRDACDPENTLTEIADMTSYPANYRKLYIKIKLDDRSKKITTCALDLVFEIETYFQSDERLDLIERVKAYAECSKEFLKQACGGVPNDEISHKRHEAEKDFIVTLESFIIGRQKNLNKVLYGNYTVEEIKAMYSNHDDESV